MGNPLSRRQPHNGRPPKKRSKSSPDDKHDDPPSQTSTQQTDHPPQQLAPESQQNSTNSSTTNPAMALAAESTTDSRTESTTIIPANPHVSAGTSTAEVEMGTSSSSVSGVLQSHQSGTEASSSPIDVTTIGSEWKSFGRAIGLSEEDMDAIQKDSDAILQVLAESGINPAAMNSERQNIKDAIRLSILSQRDGMETASSANGSSHHARLLEELDKCSDVERPARLDVLLRMPLSSKDSQLKHAWNPEDHSPNISLNDDQLTCCRNGKAKSTDCIRGRVGFSRGLHVWEITWSTEQRGTHAIVGVATNEAPLQCEEYQSLVGSNDKSWGWDLRRNKLYHDIENNPATSYPICNANKDFIVPDTFLVILDVDEGTLSFAADEKYLGIAFRNLKGNTLYPIVNIVWGHAQITMKYVGGLDSDVEMSMIFQKCVLCGNVTELPSRLKETSAFLCTICYVQARISELRMHEQSPSTESTPSISEILDEPTPGTSASCSTEIGDLTTCDVQSRDGDDHLLDRLIEMVWKKLSKECTNEENYTVLVALICAFWDKMNEECCEGQWELLVSMLRNELSAEASEENECEVLHEMICGIWNQRTRSKKSKENTMAQSNLIKELRTMRKIAKMIGCSEESSDEESGERSSQQPDGPSPSTQRASISDEVDGGPRGNVGTRTTVEGNVPREMFFFQKPLSLMSMTARLITFVYDWPYSGLRKASAMAKAGFYRNKNNPSYDGVACCYCGVELCSWEPDEDPIGEHYKWRPNCPFLREFPLGSTSTNEGKHIMPLISFSSNPDEMNEGNFENDDGNTMANFKAESMDGELIPLEMLLLQHPLSLMTAAEREITFFYDWPQTGLQNAAAMAKAGFYRDKTVPCRDGVKCRYCHHGVCCWKPYDHPMTYHRKWSPDCPFLREFPTGTTSNDEATHVMPLVEADWRRSKNVTNIENNNDDSSDTQLEGGGRSDEETNPEWNRPMLAIQKDGFVKSPLLWKVAQSFGGKWKLLGRAMKFDEDKLDTIKRNCLSQREDEMAYKILEIWGQQKSNRVSVETLAEVFQETNRPDLADQILSLSSESNAATSYPLQSEMQKIVKETVPLVSQGQSFKDVFSGDYGKVGAVNMGGMQINYASPVVEISQEKIQHVWASLQYSLQHVHEKLQIPRIPWLSEWELKFDVYYVDLSIKSKNDERMEDVQLSEIFKSSDGKNPTRLLIEGAAGYGKSTLACKLCYDHSKKEEYISHFEVVILLRLRDFENTLNELILQTLDLKNCNVQHVLETIEENQSKVLFILDGLDELSPDKWSEIIPILNTKQFPQSTVIVTSRLGSMQLPKEKADSTLTNVLHCMDSRIVINGVTEENRTQFLHRYLGHSPDKLKSILNMAENKFESIFQEKLFDSPLVLLLLVFVAEESDLGTLTTKTELYKRLFNFVLRRMLEKEDSTNQKCDFFEFNKDNPPDYVRMLNQFGFLAIRALDSSKYSFTAEELCSHCGDDKIIKLGILTQNDSKSGLKRNSWFEPVHLSFLEFSAAYHISVSVMHALDVDLFFYTRYVLLPTQDLSVEFLFALCSNQLFDLCSKLGVAWQAEMWLKKCVKFEKELETESQLKVSDLAKVLLPLVPEVLFLRSEEYDVSSRLLKETLALALRRKKVKRVVLENQCNINRRGMNSEELISWPIKVERNSDKIDDAVKEMWNEIITHQDLEIDEFKGNLKMESAEDEAKESDSVSCEFGLTFCEASLDHQSDWLSSLLSIDGLLINKPIRKMRCKIYFKHKVHFVFDFAEYLNRITELIRNEKLESVEINCTLDCIMPSEPWKDLVRHANQSKRLLDLEINGWYKETLFVELASQDKKWRKIELAENVVPYVGPILVNPDGYETWNADVILKDIPASIEYLHVKQSSTQYVFVQNSASSMVRCLREMFISIDNVQKLQQDWSYLSTLQLLAIEFDRKFNVNEQKDAISSNLLSIISNSHPRLRLEFRWNYSDEFLHNFLSKLNEDTWVESRTQEQKMLTKLNTLMLDHFMARRVKLSVKTVQLMKELLLSGQLGSLWVSGTELIEGYTTPEFSKQFSVAEGFVTKTRLRSEDETRWRPERLAFDADYYVEISGEKRNL